MSIDITAIATKFLQELRSKEFIPEEDIAWVGVNYYFLCGLDGVMMRCPIRDCNYKKFEGVEFRETQWASNEYVLHGHFAWNITKRTKDLFNWEKPKNGSSKNS